MRYYQRGDSEVAHDEFWAWTQHRGLTLNFLHISLASPKKDLNLKWAVKESHDIYSDLINFLVKVSNV